MPVTDGADPTALLASAQQGDRDAFSAWSEACRGSYIFIVIGCSARFHDDAEDLVQETSVRVGASEKGKGKTCGGSGPDVPPFEPGLTGFADRLAAIEPNTITALVTFTCLWIIWTIFAWTRNPFPR